MSHTVGKWTEMLWEAAARDTDSLGLSSHVAALIRAIQSDASRSERERAAVLRDDLARINGFIHIHGSACLDPERKWFREAGAMLSDIINRMDAIPDVGDPA